MKEYCQNQIWLLTKNRINLYKLATPAILMRNGVTFESYLVFNKFDFYMLLEIVLTKNNNKSLYFACFFYFAVCCD